MRDIDGLAPTLAAFRSGLARAFGAEAALYLHGSIAIGGYAPSHSDVDFVAVLAEPIDTRGIGEVRALHRTLRRRTPLGAKLEGLYVARGALAASAATSRFPYVKRGRLAGTHRLPLAERSILRAHGVAVAGPPACNLFAPVDAAALREEMRFNLEVYLAGRTRRPWLFLSDDFLDFALPTLGRVLHALDTGEIVDKAGGLARLAGRFPSEADLIEEVARRRRGERIATPPWQRPGRAARALRLVKRAIAGSRSSA